MSRSDIARWLHPTPQGLYCVPGGFYVDPAVPVDRAIITHGHSDHARRGHGAVLSTAETAEIMRVRYGADAAGRFEPLAIGETIRIGETSVRLAPAGHILGSAQIVIDHGGQRAVVSGDYKRAADPTAAAFEVVDCDVFVTEATFALPVFRHEPIGGEIGRLLASLARNGERTHLVGVYGLGKCQRLIAELRRAGYDAPIYQHGALVALTQLYQRLGFDLGDVRPAGEAGSADTKGALVLCPPSAITDRWSRRFGEPVTSFASGWMRIRGRARQRGVELPLIISDHADWPDLLSTIVETGASDVWVTHGREDALVHQLATMGISARALALVGFEDEDD